jgi:hypothetical protein
VYKIDPRKRYAKMTNGEMMAKNDAETIGNLAGN